MDTDLTEIIRPGVHRAVRFVLCETKIVTWERTDSKKNEVEIQFFKYFCCSLSLTLNWHEMALPKSITKKRKHAQSTLSSRKRPRKEVTSVNDLPWKSISRPNAFGFEGDDGILELEEVDDVEIVYEETENGRVAKFKVRVYV